MIKKVKATRQITVGDVVALKSGGPRMTVAGLAGFNTAVEVVFADDQNRLVKATVGVQALRLCKGR